MAIDAGTIISSLELDTGSFTSSMDEAIGQLGGMEKSGSSLDGVFQKVGRTLGGLALGKKIIDIGASAFSAAALIESSGNKVATIADLSVRSMEELQSGIASLSNETGIAASDLNEALYQTISATGDTANAVDYTGIAAKAAVGGFTDTATAIDGLTTVMNAYGLSGSEAMQKVSDQMLMAQNYGKTTFGEISSSIGNVIPLAAQLNVGTDELFASIATLTKQGIGTSEAITGLKAAFSNVIKPTDSAAKKAKQLGLDFSSAALESKGLAGFLADVMEKTGGNTDTMAELFGSVEALNTVLALCSETGQADFVGAMAAMDASAGATQNAFDTMQQGFSASWERTKNLLTNIGAGIMENVLPMATDAVNSMNGVLAMIGEGDWDGVGQAILGGVSGAIDSAGAWLSGMFTSAKQAVLAIDWSAVGETVKNGTASAIDTAGTWLKGLFEIQSVQRRAFGSADHRLECAGHIHP